MRMIRIITMTCLVLVIITYAISYFIKINLRDSLICIVVVTACISLAFTQKPFRQ
jgi:hypothetical protein